MERIDEIGFGGLKLIQEPEEFCYGIDAILLSDFAKIKRGSIVADLGTGNGIIPLVLSHKTEATKIVGVELQPRVADLASRNIALNGQGGLITILCADVKDLAGHLSPNSYDAVVSNPPYVEKSAGVKNRQQAKMIARHETSAGLAEFFSAASSLLKDKGDFFLVHRPSRLADSLTLGRQYQLEPKRIRLVHPNSAALPNIVLLHFVKNGRPELKFEKPLFVYKKDGCYTAEILKIYEKEK